MTVTKIIDHHKTPPDIPPIAQDMAAHMVVVGALGLAIARYALAAMTAEEAEAFISDFAAQSEKMAQQYNSAAVVQNVAARVDQLATQLRAARS